MGLAIGDVGQFLPHSGQMVLLDSIVSYDKESLIARAQITEQFILLDDGLLKSWAIIEIMAQAVAALDGVHCHLQGKEPKMGFLLGSRKFMAYFDVVKPPCTLQVSITQSILDARGMGVFDGTVSWVGDNTQGMDDGFIMAKAALNVFCPNNIEEYING